MRVAFVISKSHLHPNGGIGQFAKSFLEMAESLGWCVDFILDMPARNNDPLVDYIQSRGCKFIVPDQPISYSRHTSLFQFGDSFNIEKMLNFQNALTKAFTRFMYDLVISNTPEATPAYQFMDLYHYCPLIHYTHIENSVFFDAEPNDTFRPAHTAFLRNLNTCPGVIVGTQSKHNAELIKTRFPESNVLPLPMPVPELDLLEDDFPEQSGVLFIGRHEDRKNPKLFVKTVAEAGLPAKVLTKPNSVPKFEKMFAEHGVTDYEIKAGIIGKEKTDFIKSARVAFHPALRESFGFSAFESLHSCPTLLVEEYHWWANFKDMGVETCTKKTAKEKLLELYNQKPDPSNRVKRMKEVHDETYRLWKDLIDSLVIKSADKIGKNTLHSTLEEHKTIRLHDYWFKHLNRTMPNIPDFESVWYKKAHFKVIQTEDDTWISIEDDPEIPDKQGVGLFDF